MLRHLCPNFPLCIAQDPDHCCVLRLGMGLGSEDGPGAAGSLYCGIFRLYVHCPWPVLTEGGFCQDTRIIKSWDRSTRAHSRDSCSWMVQAVQYIAVRDVVHTGLVLLQHGCCSIVAVPTFLVAVSRNEPATPSAFLMGYTKSLLFYC